MARWFVHAARFACIVAAGAVVAAGVTVIRAGSAQAQRLAVAPSRTYVLPHFVEKAGRTANTQYTFDSILVATYVGGQNGVPSAATAKVEVTLYDANGSLIKSSSNQDVCNPCSVDLGGTHPRKTTIHFEDQMVAKGGMPATVVLGYAVIVVRGDTSTVALTAFEVNSHTSPFDTSVAVLPLTEVPIK